MTKLSTAAQAVLDATKFEIDAQENASLIAAAVLRTAVDACRGDKLIIDIEDLLAIANQLDGV